MAFEIGFTNLVIELGIILWLLLGWQFTLAEFIGGPIMIVVPAVLFRRFLKSHLLHEAREQADRGVAGSMEGHAAMDMAVTGEGPFGKRSHPSHHHPLKQRTRRPAGRTPESDKAEY